MLNLQVELQYKDFIKAIQILYKSTDSLTCITGLDNRFIAASDKVARLCGFRDAEEMIGKSNHEIKCEAVRCAQAFEQQNQQILDSKSPQRYFAIMKYADGKDYLLLTERTLLYDPMGRIFGINSYSQEVTNKALIQFASRLTKFDSEVSNNQHPGYYQVVEDYIFDKLSEREQECLFFMIRGKTSREISELLDISVRTVDTYVNNLKNKLGHSRKSQLIDFAIENGFLASIPQKLIESHFIYKFTD